MQGYLDKWAAEGKIPPYTSYDKPISGIDRVFCNGRKPDFCWDFGTWILNVENDEERHSREDISCHHARNQDILNGFGEVPVYMIRFNPDRFQTGGICFYAHTRQDGNAFANNSRCHCKASCHYYLRICYMFYNCTRCTYPVMCSCYYYDKFKTNMDYV
jgi:hypothetical protein